MIISYIIKAYYSKKAQLHLSYKENSPIFATKIVNDLSNNNCDYEIKESRITEDFYEEYENLTPPPSSRSCRSRSPTPLLNLNGGIRRSCKAKTRVGTPCKITSLPGRDFCYRHQSGDSIMLS